MAREKLGLALGGGAARGWAHIGVLKALRDAGIEPDVIAGTSIGAVAGGCYCAHGLEQLEKFARSLTRRKVFGYLDFNLRGSGLLSGQKLGEKLTEEFDGLLIEKLGKRFTAVATEIGTGHEIWLSEGRLADALRASYALPGIFRPVRIAGRWLIDGALVNPVPVTVCRALGATQVIAVNLNQDLLGRGTVIADQRALAAIEDEGDDELDRADTPATNGRSARQLLHRQFFGRASDEPGISTVVVEAFNIVQDRIARSRLAGDPPDYTIAPRLNGFGLFDFHMADDLIRLGQTSVERSLDDIREMLGLSVMV